MHCSPFCNRFDCVLAPPFSLLSVEGLMEGMRYSVAPDNIKVALINPGPVASNFVNRYESEATEVCGADDKPSFVARMSKLAAERLSAELRDGQSNDSCGESIVEVVERELPKKIDKGQEWVKFWNGTSESANEVITAVKCDATGYKCPQYSKTWTAALELADAVRHDVDYAHRF
jgi:hypothetical protein